MNTTEKLALVKDDPWLEPYNHDIEARLERYKKALGEITAHSGSLNNFASGHHYYGIQFDQENQRWSYREWAPNAYALFLIGDFNNWDRATHPMAKNQNGDWEIFLPYETYKDLFIHGSRIKVHVVSSKGALDRIPAYITRVVQDTETHDFCGQLWFSKPFEWTDQNFSSSEQFEQPLIYESHTGMAQEKEGLGTYQEFADEILPRIKNGGYNSVQLMAVMEHPYYGSFGYHVSNFFCASSRFGTPEDLKYLVNKAHSLGLAVIMDVVHSHAVNNVAEGLNEFDGTDHYFHGGARGYHDAWDSKLFDYGKWEVKRFLLSNLKYWLEEYHFDGFRFDGVTSMLYFHHGFTSFDHYDKYFKFDVDWDAVTYMQLANELVHSIKPNVLSIAEDVSGMPGLCRRIEEGGVGYDHRLAMGIPDFWIKYLKERADEDWNIHEMWSTLTNRRFNEKTIAYAESHDQALVGDKTLAFWLMDQEMYYHMLVSDKNLVIDRGIALHKMIRLFSMSLGGEGYLNFMGNEFGHPEWIDFPRQGNNWSYKYARRQWTLVDSDQLKYKFLSNFDKAMLGVMSENKVLSSIHGKQLNMDDSNKVIVYERSNLIFVFNFHVSNSIFGYKFQVPDAGTYAIILNSDDENFGGFGRVDNTVDYQTDENQFLQVYLTNRTALVFKKKN